MGSYTFKKSTCERYDIRWGSVGWAVIMIDENGGLFNAQSDYGDYSYNWPCHGRESFKHFILELARNKSYFLGKVSEKNHFNYEESLKNWEQQILDYRKDASITREEAREAWEFIHNLDEYSNSEQLIGMELYQSPLMCRIFSEPWETFSPVMEYSARALAFANEVMPMFAEILKLEIAEETV